MPHDRSRPPHHVARRHVEASSPPTGACRDQNPVWANRDVSVVIRAASPVDVAGLEERPGSPASTDVELDVAVARRRRAAAGACRPSSTSTAIGPTVVSIRSLAELARGPHDVLAVAMRGGGEGVGDAEVRVLPEPGGDEQLAARSEQVEVVAVVEVAIAGADDEHRLGDLVDRVVVERREHGDPPTSVDVTVARAARSSTTRPVSRVSAERRRRACRRRRARRCSARAAAPARSAARTS